MPAVLPIRSNTVRILVIEDERKLALAIREGLESQEHSVDVAHTGEEGFYLASTARFDIIILDVMLPGRDGFEILSTLRQQGVRTPVLFLTARDAIDDRVRGLDIGGDDYLVKPFAFPELLARLRALARRGNATEVESAFHMADLNVDLTRRTVVRGGQHLDLTQREFDLLEYFLRNRDRVVSREMLARDVWKLANLSTALDNVIDVQIARLRRKLDGQFDKKLLHTVRGVGFVLREEDAA
jgi:DNA-binding response OmpR family regulator